jgi:endonuclease YncB( thermonuclease family)
LGRKDLSVELVQEGLATIYTGGGAEYNGQLDILQKEQAKAQKKKLGIWSQGEEMVSPADFKKQQLQLKYAASQVN